MKFYLIAASGKKRGTPIPITVDLFTLGSAPACQLRSQLEGIGKQHCALVTRDNKVFVRDLAAGAPTLVNGAELPPGTECPLHKGDRLRVGPLEFVVQFKETALSQRDAEEWALRCLDIEDKASPKEAADFDEFAPQANERLLSAASAASSILDKLQSQRGIVKGRLRIGLESGFTVVRFNDVFLVDEAELALVKRELFSQLRQPHQRVLLDFKNVRRLSTTVADMILDLRRYLRTLGSSLALCRLKPELHPALEARDVLQTIRHFADKPTAFSEPW
jgi:anti-anti-sigma regulatory factor